MAMSIDGREIEDVTDIWVVVTDLYADKTSRIVFEDRDEAVRHSTRFGGRLGEIRMFSSVPEWDDEK